MSQNNTQSTPDQTELCARGGRRWLARWLDDGSLRLTRVADFDEGAARIVDVPPEGLARLCDMVSERHGVLELGVEDQAAPKFAPRCPVCFKPNPCDRHSYAQQIRALDDPEYLDGLVPPCDLSQAEHRDERFPGAWLIEDLKRAHPLACRGAGPNAWPSGCDYGAADAEFPMARRTAGGEFDH